MSTISFLFFIVGVQLKIEITLQHNGLLFFTICLSYFLYIFLFLLIFVRACVLMIWPLCVQYDIIFMSEYWMEFWKNR